MGLFDVFCCCLKTRDATQKDENDIANDSFTSGEPSVKQTPEIDGDFIEKVVPMETMIKTTHSIKQIDTIDVQAIKMQQNWEINQDLLTWIVSVMI